MKEIRSITESENELYDKTVSHPLQSSTWGEFKKAMGQNVECVGIFDNKKLTSAFQVSFHKVPYSGCTVGYFPKGILPDADHIKALKEIAVKNKAIFIKLEPDTAVPANSQKIILEEADKFLLDNGAVHGKNLFTKFNFHIDLTPGAETLFNNLKSKTRYNTRLAMKKGVQIVEDTSENGMEVFIRLMQETTKRQKFYSHTPEYYRMMWKIIGNRSDSMMHIFHAMFNGQALVSWIVFLFNEKLYYPYGASSDAHREVMASNIMMWDTIKYGCCNNCSSFDLWGSLGPNPDTNDPWYGFHHFKEGYNPVLMENIGTYDIVYNKFLYKSFNFADKLRWLILRALKR